MNAALNGSSAVLLLTGWAFIRAKRIGAHMACMLGACAVSSAFLVSYVLYHARVGSVRFAGAGWVRPLYFAIMIRHTVLAVVIAPMVVRTVWLAGQRRFPGHVAAARRTLPLWLYVSITGVIVYLMLYCMSQ